jgi:hypothetical protein
MSTTGAAAAAAAFAATVSSVTFLIGWRRHKNGRFWLKNGGSRLTNSQRKQKRYEAEKARRLEERKQRRTKDRKKKVGARGVEGCGVSHLHCALCTPRGVRSSSRADDAWAQAGKRHAMLAAMTEEERKAFIREERAAAETREVKRREACVALRTVSVLRHRNCYSHVRRAATRRGPLWHLICDMRIR